MGFVRVYVVNHICIQNLYFCLCHKICENEENVSLFFALVIFCDLKSCVKQVIPDIISAYLMICNVKMIAKKAKITSSQKIIEYKECNSWDYIWTMDINLGSSVAEELTRVAEVLAGFDSHEVHAAMSFPCIYMLIPPFLLQYRYSKIKTMRSECCRAHHQQSVPGLHPQ